MVEVQDICEDPTKVRDEVNRYALLLLALSMIFSAGSSHLACTSSGLV